VQTCQKWLGSRQLGIAEMRGHAACGPAYCNEEAILQVKARRRKSQYVIADRSAAE